MSENECSSRSNENEEFFGPALPPNLMNKKNQENQNEPKIIGCFVPENLITQEHNENQSGMSVHNNKSFTNQETQGNTFIGPQIPLHLQKTQESFSEKHATQFSESEETDFLGPSVDEMASEGTSYMYKMFPKKMNEATEEPDSKRESWMLELPTNRTCNFGLGSRRFQTRVHDEKESDQSVWTDTPSDKLKKKNKAKDFKDILKAEMLKKRNKEMEKLVKKALKKKKRKNESLLEIHMKKMEKKKKEAKKQEKPERRPFDRNIDLQIHRFDESKRRAIINKAVHLNDRFASGESKFL